jgi:hypothetical protein
MLAAMPGHWRARLNAARGFARPMHALDNAEADMGKDNTSEAELIIEAILA